MKKFLSIVSLTLALAVTAITTTLPCFAADAGNTTIAVGTTLSNVAVAGDIDINTVSFGANRNVTVATNLNEVIQNTIANSIFIGNLEVNNIGQ